jgi:hypothetical protein
LHRKRFIEPDIPHHPILYPEHQVPIPLENLQDRACARTKLLLRVDHPCHVCEPVKRPGPCDVRGLVLAYDSRTYLYEPVSSAQPSSDSMRYSQPRFYSRGLFLHHSIHYIIESLATRARSSRVAATRSAVISPSVRRKSHRFNHLSDPLRTS